MKIKYLGIKLILILSFAFNFGVWANVKLPSLVGDNMVLQRDTQIKLWGWAESGEKVTILFLNKQYSQTTGKDGKWVITLPSIPAGGPFEMVIKGNNTINIKNILVGDVWLASGQSNMEFQLQKVNNAETEIESANFDHIRLFSVDKSNSFQKKQECSSSGWQVCSPTTVKNFSAVAYLFGRELFDRYKLPIGLISGSIGGTPAEAWISAEGLKEFPSFQDQLSALAKLDNKTIDTYKAQLANWTKEYESIDRGRTPNGTPWTDVNLNTSDWSIMKQPGSWTKNRDLKGFCGTIWLRKEINLPKAFEGNLVDINLGVILISDSLFINGHFIGATNSYSINRKYSIPGNLVKSGRNVITLRISGANSFGGMTGLDDDLFIQQGKNRIPLSGDWLYKTGPDLSDFPEHIILTYFNQFSPQTPTVLYNAMIEPLQTFAIKGVIWYQGETNAESMSKAKQYNLLFPALIKDWRSKWGYEFPFLFVQLAGYKPDKSEPSDYEWAHLREAQCKALSLPNTGMATAIDIGEEQDIHPKNKQEVARRLALAAERVAYNEKVVFSGPTFKSMKIEGTKIRLNFDNIGSGILVKDKYRNIRGFAIAGADKKFKWANAYLDGADIIVCEETIDHPVAVRYDWGNSPDGNLYNKEDLPAIPFRTDEW